MKIMSRLNRKLRLASRLSESDGSEAKYSGLLKAAT
jgi:hypothetical protein